MAPKAHARPDGPPDAAGRRRESGRLETIHRGVYAVGHRRLTLRGDWMAAVLACGDGALLSHLAAAALWGFARLRRGPIDVTAQRGRRGPRGADGRLVVHRARVHAEERRREAAIPVTSVARTLVDLAGVLEEGRFERALEEADRLRLLEMAELERACDRAGRRQGVALWPDSRLVVELDGYAYHSHRGAFERDRARDAGLLAAGYRVLRVTHRRLADDGPRLAEELRALLAR